MFFASIPLLVEQKNVGTAYGICMIFPNIALLYGPWQVNQIIQMSQDENGDYEWLSDNLFYIGINGLGFLMAIFLYCWDMYKSEGVLNWPVYYDYGDDEYGEEEEEAEVEGDVQGDNKSSYDMKSQMRNKKKDSTTSGMSFHSNVRSQMVKNKKTIVSMRSHRSAAKQSEGGRSMNSYMKRNQGVLM